MWLKRSAALALVASTAMVGACDDENGTTGPSLDAFAGAWTASQFRYTPTHEDNQSPAFDFVGAGGSLDVTIEADGSFDGVLGLPPAMGGDDVPVSGDLSFGAEDGTIDVDFDAQTEAFLAALGIADFSAEYTLTSDTFTWSVAETDFDFNFDGEIELPEEEASLLVVLDAS